MSANNIAPEPVAPTGSFMKIDISSGYPEFERDTHLFPVDTDAQKVITMNWLAHRLDSDHEGWMLTYHHCAGEEFAHQYLCFDHWTYQVGEEDTHFAIPIGNDTEYLAFYDKVATKALSDPAQWHPIVEHLPEMMSIDVGVMYL
jgi:hypothetical protein